MDRARKPFLAKTGLYDFLSVSFWSAALNSASDET